jgi:HlyD family secretion protein
MSILIRAVAVLFGAAILFSIGWIVDEMGWLPGFPGIVPASDTAAPRRAASAESGPQAPVVALGRLEPAGRVIDVAALPGQRLDALEVQENQRVEKGQTLARLDSQPIRRLELDAAESQLKDAQARRAAEERLADARIHSAEVAIEQAHAQQLEITAEQRKVTLLKANLKLARSDLDRIYGLPRDPASTQERERQEMVVEKVEDEQRLAEATLDKANSLSKLGVQAAEADLAAAKANKDQMLSAISIPSLTAARDLARTQLDRALLVAPASGTILKEFARPGELVGGKPVLQMANLDQMVAVAEVYETDVTRIHEGQTALISSRAFPAPWDQKGCRGTVQRIGKLVMTPELKSLDPLARTDRHVVEVRVALDAEASRALAGFTNLQVDVTFPTGP